MGLNLTRGVRRNLTDILFTRLFDLDGGSHNDNTNSHGVPTLKLGIDGIAILRSVDGTIFPLLADERMVVRSHL